MAPVTKPLKQEEAVTEVPIRYLQIYGGIPILVCRFPASTSAASSTNQATLLPTKEFSSCCENIPVWQQEAAKLWMGSSRDVDYCDVCSL